MGTLLRVVDMDYDVPRLQKENLESVFKNIPKGAKVAVLGVCGNFRQGKSFLLNVLLAGLEDPTKLDGDAAVFGGASGIPFSAGLDAHTKGILFWSKPLCINTAKGEDLYVLLMDTQGTFDMEHDKKVSVQTFAVANLISSFLIFNKNKQLELPDVEGLQLFVKYGKHLHESVGQHLLVLLRDFLERDSGVNEDYINYLRAKSSGSKEISSTLQDIEKSFEKFTCFTLTEPPRIVKTAKGALTAKDCGPEFLEGLKKLMVYVRGNLEEKQMKGVAMRADDLKMFIETVVGTIKTGKAPEILTAYAAVERASLLKAEKEFGEIVERLLATLSSGVADAVFGEKLKTTRETLLKDLKAVNCFGNKEKREASEKSAIANFDKKSSDLRTANCAIFAKQRLTSLVADTLREFTSAVTPYLGAQQFPRLKESEREKAVTKLKSSCEALPEYPAKDSDVQASVKDLETNITTQCSSLDSQHTSKMQIALRDLENSLCSEFQRACSVKSSGQTVSNARANMDNRQRETVDKMRNNWSFQTVNYSLGTLEDRLRNIKESELRQVQYEIDRRRQEQQHAEAMQRERERREAMEREAQREAERARQREQERREAERQREADRRERMQQQMWSPQPAYFSGYGGGSLYGGGSSYGGGSPSYSSTPSAPVATSPGGRSFGGYSKNGIKLGRPRKS